MPYNAPMTTPIYTPGVCCNCSRPAPVLMPDGSGIDEGVGYCKPCYDELMYNMGGHSYTEGPSAWWPGVEADHPDWY